MGEDSATSGPITVMVVDDHPMWRDGVSRDLDAAGFRVVATADGVGAAARRAAAVQPAVVLMDMTLPDGTGTEATVAVLRASPASRVLVLSASSERDDVLGAVKAGACGYLVKSASAAALAEAVRATAAGQAVFTPGLAGLVLGEYRRMSSGEYRRMSSDSGRRAPPRPPSPNARPRCCGSSRRDCRPSRSPPGSPSATARWRTTSRPRCASCSWPTASS